MYSLLLMTALSSGGGVSAADAGAPVAAPMVAPVVVSGCTGCTGVPVSYGCCGYSTSYGCCGGWASCHGCCGGRGGLFSGLFHGKSCHGCCGGYSTSYGCCGGYSTSYACCGGSGHGFFRGSCHGCWGSYSSCYGSCYGSCTGAMYYHQGCYGSMAPVGCVGYAPVVMPAAPVPTTPAPMPTTPAPTTTPEKKTSANITIELPADAALTVDGEPTRTTGTVRLFHTPELQAGQAYYYDMKAEVVVDGRTVVEEMRVVVTGGEQVTKSFGKLIAAAKGDAKTVAAK